MQNLPFLASPHYNGVVGCLLISIYYPSLSLKQTWNDETVKLVILIGIAYHERKMFRSVINQLINIFTNEAHVLSISKCKTYDEIISTKKAILEDMYKYEF